MVNETAKRELAGLFPNEVIRASAGTGKTFALSNRYLKLLASGAECQNILATTFTRKGAGEILDRIISRLSDAALDPQAAAELSEQLEFAVPKKRAEEILHELLRNLHRLEIGTLDSFFNRVAQVFSLELRLPPTWEIVDEQRMNRLNDRAIQKVLRRKSTLNLLHMLSKGEAARRVASLVHDTVNTVYEVFRESGSDPWDRLPVSGRFLPAEELEQRIAQIAAMQFEGKALPKHWEEVKRHAINQDWDAFASTTSFQNFLDGNFKFGRSNLPDEIVAVYQQLLPHCRAFVETRIIQQNHSTRDLLEEFERHLEETKDETGQLRFDDVTRRLQGFVSMWDTGQFAFRLDHQIQHLLLDEFQDTSLGQWQVIRPFAHKVTEENDSLRSFFCVGDMKQAIFGWRGGVAEIFDLIEAELANLEETKTLQQSYRSSQPVIDAVNSIFLNVDQYHCDDPVIEDAISQWSHWFPEHTTARAELPGYVTVEMADDCQAAAKRDPWSKDFLRNQNVVTKTVERVSELVATLPAHHQIGLIVRTNKEVGEFMFQLQQAGIQASEEGGNPLTDSAAVEYVLSAIQLADQPGDSIARFHLSHGPLASRLGLEPETETNQRENLAAASIAAANLRQQLVTEGYGPTVESLARQLMEQCTQRELLRLQQLVRVSYASPSDNEQWQLRPGRFVSWVRDEVKVSDQSSANVRVMTIHKAKGLEFDVVVHPLQLSSRGWAGMTPSVLAGRENPTAPIDIATRYVNQKLRKLLPENFQQIFDQDKRTNVREAMCVLYVALTRSVYATHVIMSHGAKPTHKSAGGILLSTICDGKREAGILYEHGDPTWHQKTTRPTEKRDPHRLQDFYLPDDAIPKVDTISRSIKSGRGIPRLTPSMLAGGDKRRVSTIFRSETETATMSRGPSCTAVSSWFTGSTRQFPPNRS